MPSEEEYAQAINALAGKYNELDSVVQAHEKALSSKKEEELPMYLAKNTRQMAEELEQQGKFGPKEAPGLQDDFDNAFRMFTHTNDRGDLIYGLMGPGGRPASLMDLYQTMDLRGVVWNYGIGWLSALKGGWNSEVAIAKKSGKKKVEEIKQEASVLNNLDNLISYRSALDSFHKRYGYKEEWNDTTKQFELRKIKVPKIRNNITKYYDVVRDKKKLIGVMESTPTADTYPDSNWPNRDQLIQNGNYSSIIPVKGSKIGVITETWKRGNLAKREYKLR